MTLARFRAENHPQQVRARGAYDIRDDRATDPAVFDILHRKFAFTIDVAASATNAKLERFFTREQDGLTQPWAGERVWCNPPYSDLAPWVTKAWLEDEAELIVMLLPANRTEQQWWQQLVEPYRDRNERFTCEFLPGRLRFIRHDRERIGPNERPPFGCCLLIWQRGADPRPIDLSLQGVLV